MHQVELAEEHRARIENRQMCQVQMLIRQNHCRDLRRYNAPNFYSYRLAIRPGFSPIHYGRRLFQQYVVDAYVKTEGNRLNYIRQNQSLLRVELYQGLMDYIHEQEHSRGVRIGRIFILPSSFPGSSRAMQQNYQDAMAIVRKFGRPDLFVTFTCNPRWTDIVENLLPNQNPSDRPDLVARVFNLKLQQLLHEIVSQHVLGVVIARVHVVEFQKRGLPHAHMLFMLREEDKPRDRDAIDRLVCAEIPSPTMQVQLYDMVRKHMIHGPCGNFNLHSPCMSDGKCTKDFPKSFLQLTEANNNGYPRYRRRDDGQTLVVGTHEVDNRWVVPYNPYLLVRFNAHINVEVCASVKSVKYLFKYVYKGHDRAEVEVSVGELDMESRAHDEIKNFLDARAVGKIVIPLASTGIAATLLSGGQTVHSRFKLPIPLLENSVAAISANSSEAELIRRSSLIIWDEAPMAHYRALEIVDRLLKDIMHCDLAFGGKVVVLGGDFRQVLPVVPRASRAEIVAACIKQSKLWPLFVILRLTQNMRAGIDAQSFSHWLLKVGDGDLPTDQQGLISLPESCIFHGVDLVQEIFGSSYGDITALSQSVILTLKNTDSLEINEKVLDRLPNRSQCFLSVDSVECENVEEQNNYPTEFLNSLTPTGMPPHRLNLKIGAIVMLLRNLNPKQGLCNGTRMVIQRMRSHVLEAQILTGTKVGQTVLVPKISLAPSDTNLPFILKRRQFPLRLAFAMTINKAQGQTFARREQQLFEVKLFSPCFDFVSHRNGGSTNLHQVLCKKGFKGAEIFWMLQTAYGDAVMSRRRVLEWYKRFKEGREETADNERSGRPSTSTTPEKVDKVLELGIVHHEFQQQVSTITADSYLGVLRRLREAIRQKRPELWRSKSWILHHDNAHTALKNSKFLQDHSTSVFPQPPYSPDLAPCDFFLFGKLKKGKGSEILEHRRDQSGIEEGHEGDPEKRLPEVFCRLEKKVAEASAFGMEVWCHLLSRFLGKKNGLLESRVGHWVIFVYPDPTGGWERHLESWSNGA
ncbi:hypothetical protein LAZ67_19002139 [Cordylochernes scorpioides]|uniref:ATP-dependent DNA helicase n=1 Tax=Cordylochernes scorpioides TaxID=51811 RepID=A0ABY6LIK1_9ARAC|nr:hypothetical protein LAZ67_19002139 [Cordylochernes scorpioides]